MAPVGPKRVSIVSEPRLTETREALREITVEGKDAKALAAAIKGLQAQAPNAAALKAQAAIVREPTLGEQPAAKAPPTTGIMARARAAVRMTPAHQGAKVIEGLVEAKRESGIEVGGPQDYVKELAVTADGKLRISHSEGRHSEVRQWAESVLTQRGLRGVKVELTTDSSFDSGAAALQKRVAAAKAKRGMTDLAPSVFDNIVEVAVYENNRIFVHYFGSGHSEAAITAAVKETLRGAGVPNVRFEVLRTEVSEATGEGTVTLE